MRFTSALHLDTLSKITLCLYPYIFLLINVDERERQRYSSSYPLYPNDIYAQKTKQNKKGKKNQQNIFCSLNLHYSFKPLKILEHVGIEKVVLPSSMSLPSPRLTMK